MTEQKRMGWECPKCGRIYSPYIPQCLDCPMHERKQKAKQNADRPASGATEPQEPAP